MSGRISANGESPRSSVKAGAARFTARSIRTTGEPVLIDLGLVKDVTLPVVHRGESLSIVNGKAVGVGTPRYAAPEQFAGGEISPAADIHALGMLANDCFGGNPPLPWARIIRRSTSSIPSPPQLRPGVRFVPDSDSGAESTRKGAKWPKSGVFSGDKEVDPNF